MKTVDQLNAELVVAQDKLIQHLNEESAKKDRIIQLQDELIKQMKAMHDSHLESLKKFGEALTSVPRF